MHFGYVDGCYCGDCRAIRRAHASKTRNQKRRNRK